MTARAGGGVVRWGGDISGFVAPCGVNRDGGGVACCGEVFPVRVWWCGVLVAWCGFEVIWCGGVAWFVVCMQQV